MWSLKRQPRSQDEAGITSDGVGDSCSDSRAEPPNTVPQRRKRKTTTEMIFRLIVGSPEGIRTLDLMAENHASWTARRRGHESG